MQAKEKKEPRIPKRRKGYCLLVHYKGQLTKTDDDDYWKRQSLLACWRKAHQGINTHMHKWHWCYSSLCLARGFSPPESCPSKKNTTLDPWGKKTFRHPSNGINHPPRQILFGEGEFSTHKISISISRGHQWAGAAPKNNNTPPRSQQGHEDPIYSLLVGGLTGGNLFVVAMQCWLMIYRTPEKVGQNVLLLFVLLLGKDQ